ncbi:MAG: VOC family protein [Candidatus Kariarchaeaceae archaeon]|jgi:predicted enzyme related to lactoylglutathione lyase
MKGELSYVRILTKDFPKSFNFYQNQVGLEIKLGDENSTYAEFKTGNTILALFKCKLMHEALGIDMEDCVQECQDKNVIIFAVENVEEEYQRLKENGIIFLTGPTDRPDWSVRTAHFRDPDGTILEINQRI